MDKLTVSSSPHMHGAESVSSIMSDVVIALFPSALMGVYMFGYRAAAVILTAVAACVATELFYEKLTGRRVTVGDMSAVVTGLLLGLNMPVTVPLYMVVIGAVFAIAVVKQLYGGLGRNFMNPALAARCFMMLAWAGAMTSFTEPGMGYGADALSQATPLAILKGEADGALPSLGSAFLGCRAGAIGETSGAMLILGGVYLLARRVITPHIPTAFVASFAVLTYLFGANSTGDGQLYYTALSVCSGGLLLGSIFMATDYVTTPTTPRGQVIFGIGCGALTFVIRKFGGYPEGVSFAILLMNVATPLIDRYIRRRAFGEVKANGRKTNS